MKRRVKRVTARSRDMDLPNSFKGARFRRRLRCTGTGTDLSFGSTESINVPHPQLEP
jgi:hypothetical protein